jgi:hypothetical protein
MSHLLIGWADENGKNIPKIRTTRQIHHNRLDEAILIDSSLIFVFNLVALLARGVIF